MRRKCGQLAWSAGFQAKALLRTEWNEKAHCSRSRFGVRSGDAWLRNFGRCPHPSHRRPRVLSGRVVSTERAWLVVEKPLETFQRGTVLEMPHGCSAEAFPFSEHHAHN